MVWKHTRRCRVISIIVLQSPMNMESAVELLTCPVCKVAMSRIAIVDRELDNCSVCGGVWLDSSELETALSNAQTLRGSAASVIYPDLCECPRCSKPLASSNYGYDSNVSVQKCVTCNGTWLHHTQLSEIAKFRSSVHQPSFAELLLLPTFQSENRWQRASGIVKSPFWACGTAIALGVCCLLLAAHPAQSTIFFFTRAVLPILCIWQCDWLGQFTGIGFRLAGPRITEKTPPLAVAMGGWLLLLASFVAALLKFRQQ